MAETSEMMKSKLLKAQNLFSTTAASSNHFKSTESSHSKHKRSKIYNNVKMADSEVAITCKPNKKKEALAQIKSDMKNLYNATEEGKYKFPPNRKIVYVTKSQIKKKSSKRCSSTDGNASSGIQIKKKIAGISKNSKAVILN